MRRDWDERARRERPLLRQYCVPELDRRGILRLRRAHRGRGDPHRHDQYLPGQGPRARCGCSRSAAAPAASRALWPACSARSMAWISAARWWPAPREALAEFPNAHVYQNNGTDLSVLPGGLRVRLRLLVHRLPAHPQLRESSRTTSAKCTACCARAGCSSSRCRAMPRSRPRPRIPGWESRSPTSRPWRWPRQCGFEPRYRHGAGEQYFWLWFFKNR